MDAFNKIVQIPSWAYDFCYYYLAVAVLVVDGRWWMADCDACVTCRLGGAVRA